MGIQQYFFDQDMKTIMQAAKDSRLVRRVLAKTNAGLFDARVVMDYVNDLPWMQGRRIGLVL